MRHETDNLIITNLSEQRLIYKGFQQPAASFKPLISKFLRKVKRDSKSRQETEIFLRAKLYCSKISMSPLKRRSCSQLFFATGHKLTIVCNGTFPVWKKTVPGQIWIQDLLRTRRFRNFQTNCAREGSKFEFIIRQDTKWSKWFCWTSC